MQVQIAIICVLLVVFIIFDRVYAKRNNDTIERNTDAYKEVIASVKNMTKTHERLYEKLIDVLNKKK